MFVVLLFTQAKEMRHEDKVEDGCVCTIYRHSSHFGVQVLDDYDELRPFLLFLECFNNMACSTMNDSEPRESPC